MTAERTIGRIGYLRFGGLNNKGSQRASDVFAGQDTRRTGRGGQLGCTGGGGSPAGLDTEGGKPKAIQKRAAQQRRDSGCSTGLVRRIMRGREASGGEFEKQAEKGKDGEGAPESVTGYGLK